MNPPASNELEISLFGPGYGESVLVHVGANQWAILDSCRDPGTGFPATLGYLDSLGVDPATSVRVVVATHWHDDHIRGLAETVQRCSDARFVCASALTKREFVAMVTRYEARNEVQGGSGVREIFEVLRYLAATKRQTHFAAPDRPVFRFVEAEATAGGSCILTTLSPADKQLELFFQEIAAMMPEVRQPKRRAIPQGPNHVAVAVWISAGPEAILLGSDLEETGDPDTGWTVITNSKTRPRGLAGVFKIPHHGSMTGHSSSVWERMVAPNIAYALLTPFTRGSVSLPTVEDVSRIRGRTSNAYATSRIHSRSIARRAPEIERGIRETVGRLRAAETRFGRVTLRKPSGPGRSWALDLSGNACHLQDIFH
jgi:beta-lactamase superfamily II metal-dependent hydrolase